MTILRPGSAHFHDLAVADVLTLGPDTELTGLTVDTFPRLDVNGVYTNFHDVRFRHAIASDHNGTISGGAAGGDTSVPRVTFAKPGTKRLKWLEDVPAGWTGCGINFSWCKEVAGAGNVHWMLTYQIVNFLLGTDILAGAVTTVYNTALAVPAGVGAIAYQITGAGFSTPAQAFGIPPLIMGSLSRIDDGTDTFAGAVSVPMTSLSLTT